MDAIWQCIRRVGGLASILLLVGAAGAAQAQLLSGYFPAGVPGYDTMPGVTVLSRARPDYQPLGIPTHGAPVAEGELIWSPSGMDTVTATLTRSIEDAAQEGVSGYTYTAGTLIYDHEYARDILLQLTGGVQRADFLQGAGGQTALLFGAGVTWLIDRQMSASATYDFNDQQGGSVGTAGPFTRSIGLLTLRFGW
jgi:hypothetical protein